MFTDYWYSQAAGRWLLADKTTGILLAQFSHRAEITGHFLPEVIHHLTEQCECSDCEDARDDAAIDNSHSVNEILQDCEGYSIHEYSEGGFGDSFS